MASRLLTRRAGLGLGFSPPSSSSSLRASSARGFSESDLAPPPPPCSSPPCSSSLSLSLSLSAFLRSPSSSFFHSAQPSFSSAPPLFSPLSSPLSSPLFSPLCSSLCSFFSSFFSSSSSSSLLNFPLFLEAPSRPLLCGLLPLTVPPPLYSLAKPSIAFGKSTPIVSDRYCPWSVEHGLSAQNRGFLSKVSKSSARWSKPLKPFLNASDLCRLCVRTMSTQADSEAFGAAVKVKAAEIAEPFRQETQDLVAALPKEVKPLLVGFLASDDPASKRYAEWTGRSCEKDGINFELRECQAYDLEEKVLEANADPKVHGIMIYYPCFGAVPSFYGGRMDDHLRDIVAVEKDVEGLCFTYRHYLYHNVRYLPKLSGEPSDKKCLLPCTPLALVKILEGLNVYDETLPKGNRMSGQTVTVINRSEIVGRPLGAMLANDGADVFSVDIDSIYLMRRAKMLPTEVTVEEACKRSKVIVTGVPTENYKLPTEWVQPGTVVLNVSHYKNVDEEALLKIPGVRYVSLVGKVTVAMLERNLIRLINNFHLPDSNVKVVEAGGRVVDI